MTTSEEMNHNIKILSAKAKGIANTQHTKQYKTRTLELRQVGRDLVQLTTGLKSYGSIQTI